MTNTGIEKPESSVAQADHPNDGASTYERLLVEAASLFRKRGYERTSTRELANSIGIQKASLYHYMKSKEHLLFEMCMRGMERMDSRIGSAIEGAEGPLDQLGELIEHHVATMLEQPNVYAASLIELRSLTGEKSDLVLNRRRDYENLVRDIVTDAQASGSVRSDIDPKYLTLLLLGTMNWTLLWFQLDGDISPAEMGRLVRTFLLGGLATATP